MYRLENISKNKSFNFGVFGNTGDWSSILGYGSYNTGNYSNIIGSNNYNSKTYSTLIGTQNANTGNYSILIGYNNKATAGNYPCAIGVENTLNAYGYAIGRKNVINGNGYSFGFDNLINTNGTSTVFLFGQKLICENNKGGFFIGQYNKEYISNDASIANWFAIGCGDPNSPRQNAIEVKQNADTYIYGVGGFTGTNSDSASVKPINTVISELQAKSTVTDVQVKEKDSDSYASVLDNGVAQIDLSKKLELTDNKSLVLGNTNNTTSKDSIASGVGVNIIGDRSFGFGEAYVAIYLTGDTSSNVYTAKLFNKTNSNDMNKVADVFKTTHVNAYILETTNFTRVAKITAINWTDENNPLTVTLDTNLGVLTDGQYCIENIGGAKTFSVGTFGNTGTYSTVFGNGNYNTGNYSLVSGYKNTNKSNYSNVLGYWNKNAEAGASVMGYANKNAGLYPVVLGLENDNSGSYSVLLGRSNVNKCSNTNIIGYGNTVNETTYPSNILGMDNTVDANAQSFILGYSNHGTRGTYAPANASCTFILGHNLTTSRGGIALGWYNKDYDVETLEKQNFLVVGQGTANQPLNTIEQKANGDLYVFGIGGFNGTNSDIDTVKTVQGKINELQNTITSLQNRITALENQLNGNNA